MQKLISTFLLFSLILLSCKENDQPTYHNNKYINKIIINYNKISENKIGIDDLNNDSPDDVLFKFDDITIKIRPDNNGRGALIELYQYSKNRDRLKKHAALFIKSINPIITDFDINVIFRNLMTSKENPVKMFIYKNFTFTFTEQTFKEYSTNFYSILIRY